MAHVLSATQGRRRQIPTTLVARMRSRSQSMRLGKESEHVRIELKGRARMFVHEATMLSPRVAPNTNSETMSLGIT